MADPLKRLEDAFGDLGVWDESTVMASTTDKVPQGASSTNPPAQLGPSSFASNDQPKHIFDDQGRVMHRIGHPLAILHPELYESQHDTYVRYDDEASSAKDSKDKAPENFCPWTLLLHYHRLFVGKENRKVVRPFFTVETILNSRPWDFYYLYHPQKPYHSAILFIRTEQLVSYLELVNSKLEFELGLPQGRKADYIRFNFGAFGTPTPQFVGKTKSSSSVSTLVNSIPAFSAQKTWTRLSETVQEDFIERLEMIERVSVGEDADKQRAKKKAKARERCIKARMDTGQAIKRVQRYLGLRAKAGSAEQPDRQGGTSGTGPPGGALDTNFTMPLEPESRVVFISVDVELFEFNHSHITEVGVAILDTLDTIGVPPGNEYQNWFDLIKAHHFRIEEYRHQVNRKHVKGCELFFDFGKSEMIKLRDIRPRLNEMFGISRTSPAKSSSLLESRHIVIVGHDIALDIDYLKRLGVYIDSANYDIADTQTMHQHYRHRKQGAKLKDVLGDLQLTSRYLHNGGNDAVYTLRAMIALAFKTRELSLNRASVNSCKDDESEDESEGGWSTGGEDSDGGSAPWEPKVHT